MLKPRSRRQATQRHYHAETEEIYQPVFAMWKLAELDDRDSLPLIRAVADHGFKELDRAFSQVPVTEDSIADLFALA